jgi:hypothetical protein
MSIFYELTTALYHAHYVLIHHLNRDKVKNKYIFVGSLTHLEYLRPILKDIEKSPDVGHKHIKDLKRGFGPNFDLASWGSLNKAEFNSITFLEYYVQPDNTIFYLQLLISLIPELHIPIEHQYLWAQSSTYAHIEMHRIWKQLYRESSHGVLVSDVQSHLHLEPKVGDGLGTEVVYTYDTFMNDPEIVRCFESFSLSINYKFQDSGSISNYPFIHPYLLIENLSSKENIDFMNRFHDAKSALMLKHNIKFQNHLLDSLNLHNNEIHLISYNSAEFKQPKPLSVSDDVFTSGVLLRYFPYYDTKVSIENAKDVSMITNQYAILNYVRYMTTLPKASRIIGKNICEIRINIELELSRDILRELINNFQLSSSVPFVRIFDDQTNENIYRIHRPSYMTDSMNHIPKDLLESWFRSETSIMNLGKLYKIREPRRCISFKVKICNQILTRREPIPIESQYSHRRTVYYTSGNTETDVEDYLFTPAKDAVYQHEPVYADILIVRKNYRYETICKIVFSPDAEFHSDYTTLFRTKCRDFLIQFGAISPLSKEIVLTDVHIQHLSSIVEFPYNNYEIEYEKCRDIILLMNPYFMFMDPIITDEQKKAVQYNIDGRFKNVSIMKTHTNGTYDIITKRGQEIKGIPSYQLRVIGEKKRDYLHFRYKRVNEFNAESSPLRELVNKYKSWGITDENIKMRIKMEIIEATDHEITQVLQTTENISKESSSSNGVDIRIYLDKYGLAANHRIEIDNYHNIHEFNKIIYLLEVVFHMYESMHTPAAQFMAEELTTFGIQTELSRLRTNPATFQISGDVIAPKNIVQKKDTSAQPVAPAKKYNFDIDSDDEDDDEGENIDANDDVGSATSSVSVADDGGKTTSTIAQNTAFLMDTSSIFLKTLQVLDSKIFDYKSTNPKQEGYSRQCTVQRYPKAVNNTEYMNIIKENIDQQQDSDSESSTPRTPFAGTPRQSNKSGIPYSNGLGATYMGDGFKQKYEQECASNQTEDGQLDINKGCTSIKYGSEVDEAHWNNVYMCPKIWCVGCKIPLHTRHLVNGRPKISSACGDTFQSKADLPTNDAIFHEIKREEIMKNYDGRHPVGISLVELQTLDAELKKVRAAKNSLGDDSAANVLERKKLERWEKFIDNLIKKPADAINEYDMRYWRICIVCNKDILEHDVKCPSCKRGTFAVDNKTNKPTDTESISIISPTGSQYIYPGFLDPNSHPDKLHMPCCFSNPNFRLDHKYSFNTGKTKTINESYIQPYGSKVLDRGRLGQLPRALSEFFNLDDAYFSMRMLPCTEEPVSNFFRYGVSQQNHNMIDVFSAIITDSAKYRENSEKYKLYIKPKEKDGLGLSHIEASKRLEREFRELVVHKIVEKMDDHQLTQHPLIRYAMTGIDGVSPTQNYIEYLLSGEYIHDFTILSFLNRELTWLDPSVYDREHTETVADAANTDIFNVYFGHIPANVNVPRKFIIIIISINREGNMTLELPRGFVQPSIQDPDAYFILLFKRPASEFELVANANITEYDDTSNYNNQPLYEPIYEIISTCAKKGSKLQRKDETHKVFSRNHPLIQKLLTHFDLKPQNIPQGLTITDTNFNEMMYKTYEWFRTTDDGNNIELKIIDNADYIVGIVLKNGFYLPLYPMSNTNTDDIHTMLFVEYIQQGDVKSFDETNTFLIDYAKKPEFAYLMPHKIIEQPNSMDIRKSSMVMNGGVYCEMTDNKKRPCHKTDDASRNSDKCSVSPKGLCALTKEHTSPPKAAAAPVPKPEIVKHKPCKVISIEKCPKEMCVQYNGQIRQGCREKPVIEREKQTIKPDKGSGYIGFITHGGGIVPFLKTSGVDDNTYDSIEFDFYEIETTIERNQSKNIYSRLNTYDEIVDKVGIENITLCSSPTNKREISGIIIKNDDIKITNLYLPIVPMIIQPEMKVVSTPPESRLSFVEVVKTYQKLAQSTGNTVHCRPVGFMINSDKIIKTLILETGAHIAVLGKPYSHILSQNENKAYVIHNIRQLELNTFDTETFDSIVKRTRNELGDDARIHFIRTINHLKSSYMRFRFEIAQIINNEPKIKTHIYGIINAYRNNMLKYTDIMVLLQKLTADYMIADEHFVSIHLQPNTCITHTSPEMCIADSRSTCKWEESANNPSQSKSMDDIIMQFQNLGPISKRIMNEKRSILTNIDKVVDVMAQLFEKGGVVLEEYERMKSHIRTRKQLVQENMRDNIIAYIHLKIYGMCKYITSNIEKYVRKLVYELLYHPYKRYEILENNIKLVETKLSYNIYQNEQLLTHSDIKRSFYETLYSRHLSHRLFILDFFTRNSSMYANTKNKIIIEVEPLIDRMKPVFHLQREPSNNVNFHRMGQNKFIIRQSLVERPVRYVNHFEAGEIIHSIMRKNTPLLHFPLGKTSNTMDFNIIL